MPLCFASDASGIKTEVEPGRAGVFIDGKYVGPAANFKHGQSYDVKPGQHEIKLIEPRYQDIVKTVNVESGKRLVVKETMVALPKPMPPFGNIRTKNKDHYAAVYVNERFMGHVDEFSNPGQVLKLKPGSYDVKIVPINGAPVAKTVTVETDKTVIVE